MLRCFDIWARRRECERLCIEWQHEMFWLVRLLRGNGATPPMFCICEEDCCAVLFKGSFTSDSFIFPHKSPFTMLLLH